MSIQTNFYNYSLSSLAEFFAQKGDKSFRAKQLFRWVYAHQVTDIDQMTNIAKSSRQQWKDWFFFELPKMVTHLKSVDGTQKFLFATEDGLTFESVLIPAKDRLTLCISSEVGCNMACQFCYTGKQKLKRRLSVSEIVGQLLQVSAKLPEDQRVTNIVFMGMGEPLDNPEAVFSAIDIMHSPYALNMSRRRITVSTSGIVPLIPRVTAAGAQLAVSLNAADDETRDRVMPINKKWPIKVLLEACAQHAKESKEKMMFEYVLLKDVTDSIEDARKLHRLTKNIPCKINIIPFNEHPGSGFYRPSEEKVHKFQNELIRLGSHVLKRKTMGRDIYAACGQLTSAHKEHPKVLSL